MEKCVLCKWPKVSKCLCAVSQVMLNSPKRIAEEKIKMAEKEKARIEKESKIPAKTNSANGTGGTPIHVSTLQVSVSMHMYSFKMNVCIRVCALFLKKKCLYSPIHICV